MRGKTNCPNCGAPITGSKCEYCGTVFETAERIYQMDASERIFWSDDRPVLIIKDVPDDFLTLNEKRKICGLEEVKTAPPLTQKR